MCYTTISTVVKTTTRYKDTTEGLLAFLLRLVCVMEVPFADSADAVVFGRSPKKSRCRKLNNELNSGKDNIKIWNEYANSTFCETSVLPLIHGGLVYTYKETARKTNGWNSTCQCSALDPSNLEPRHQHTIAHISGYIFFYLQTYTYP